MTTIHLVPEGDAARNADELIVAANDLLATAMPTLPIPDGDDIEKATTLLAAAQVSAILALAFEVRASRLQLGDALGRIATVVEEN
jgi:hypothetical protein